MCQVVREVLMVVECGRGFWREVSVSYTGTDDGF